MTNPMFRKSALDALSSPEQLGQLLTVTGPRSWIALIAILGLLASVVAWGFLGSLPTRVTGRGVLIHDGGAFNVVAASNGVLSELRPLRAGDRIHKGEVIGHLAHPAIDQQIEAAQSYVDALKAQQISGSRLARATDRLDDLQLQAELGADIIADRDGVVVEMLATDGDILKEGQPVLTFEQPNSPIQAVVYLPANGAARRLRPGMAAEISPATTERALDGYLLGKVRAVSKYPATEAGMMSLINNAPLVQALMKHGPPIAVDVDLIPDATAADGYRWSSRRGQAQILSSGLLASGAFVTDTRRPISLIFPRLHDAQGR